MPDLTPATVRRAYARLQREYAAMTGVTNPSKTAMELSRASGQLDAFGNVMPAALTDGHWGAKVIRVDETTGAMAAVTVVFDAAGALVRSVASAELTRVRCGLMAALACERFFGARVRADGFTLGLVGTGATQQATFRVLNALFGIEGGQVLIKGSPRAPLKNAARFPGARAVADARALAACDAVIECATIRDRAEALEIVDFCDPVALTHPRLFVAQDSGWLFGATFRALPGYADHVAQINAHRTGDYDWPWDAVAPVIERDLRHPGFRWDKCPSGAVAYLTGVALADLVIALEAAP